MIDVIDRTLSPMGGRLLKRWVALPSCEKDVIISRHNIVKFLISDEKMNELIHNAISNLSDIERLTSKLATKKINPREIFSLKHSVELIENLKSDIYKTECMELNHLIDSIQNCTDFISKVSNT